MVYAAACTRTRVNHYSAISTSQLFSLAKAWLREATHSYIGPISAALVGPGPFAAAILGPGPAMAMQDGPGPTMAATSGPPDQLWLPRQVPRPWDQRRQGRTNYGSHSWSGGTICGSHGWSRTILDCHNWSPRTNCGWDQFARDSSIRPQITAALLATDRGTLAQPR